MLEMAQAMRGLTHGVSSVHHNQRNAAQRLGPVQQGGRFAGPFTLG